MSQRNFSLKLASAKSPVVRWPDHLRGTAQQKFWFRRFEGLEPGLGLHQIADRFGVTYYVAYNRARLFGYEFADSRFRHDRNQWSRVDWNLSNVAIARQLGVSPSRVRDVRRKIRLAVTS